MREAMQRATRTTDKPYRRIVLVSAIFLPSLRLLAKVASASHPPTGLLLRGPFALIDLSEYGLSHSASRTRLCLHGGCCGLTGHAQQVSGAQEREPPHELVRCLLQPVGMLKPSLAAAS